MDSFMLADGAEAFKGKLYIHGGGWNFLNLTGPEAARHVSVAGRVIVPWDATDQELVLGIHLEREEDSFVSEPPPLVRLVLQPQARPEHPLSPETATPFAFEVGAVSFSQPGGYAFVIAHGLRELARTRFQVNFTGALDSAS